MNLIRFLLIALTTLCVVDASSQNSKPSPIIRGIHFTGGSVADSTTKKSQPNITLYCISGSDTVVMKANARGNFGVAKDSLEGSPDSVLIVCATPGFHVTRYKIKVFENGSLPDQSGNINTFSLVEVDVRVSKD